jgi:hypothetical protein
MDVRSTFPVGVPPARQVLPLKKCNFLLENPINLIFKLNSGIKRFPVRRERAIILKIAIKRPACHKTAPILAAQVTD